MEVVTRCHKQSWGTSDSDSGEARHHIKDRKKKPWTFFYPRKPFRKKKGRKTRFLASSPKTFKSCVALLKGDIAQHAAALRMMFRVSGSSIVNIQKRMLHLQQIGEPSHISSFNWWHDSKLGAGGWCRTNSMRKALVSRRVDRLTSAFPLLPSVKNAKARVQHPATKPRSISRRSYDTCDLTRCCFTWLICPAVEISERESCIARFKGCAHGKHISYLAHWGTTCRIAMVTTNQSYPHSVNRDHKGILIRVQDWDRFAIHPSRLLNGSLESFHAQTLYLQDSQKKTPTLTHHFLLIHGKVF